MELKSTCVLKDKLNYDEVAVIKQLYVTPQVLAMHEQRLSEIFKHDKPEQIRQKVMDIVARDNAFASIMQNIIEKAFSFNFDEDEVKNIIDETKDNIAKNLEAAYKEASEEDKAKFAKLEDHPFYKMTEEQQRNFALAQIKKQLIFDELAKLWDIRVSDEEVRTQLENFYKASNKSVRNYLNNKAEFEHVRKMIRDEKITKEILIRFRVNWELPLPPKAEDKK